MEVLLTILGIGFLIFILFIMTIKNVIYICGPNEVLIFAGPRKALPSGSNKRSVGYTYIRGGRGIRVPLFEQVYHLELTNIPIDVSVDNGFSKGGIPLSVTAVANVKLSGNEPLVHNAIERFLGKRREEIVQIAQETLEGNLRGVLASLTPEQVNEDKAAFTKKLLEEADEDLSKLGIVLDNLQIQNISDKVGYLDSIGRKQAAMLQRDAIIAEASNRAESIIKDAENKKKTTLKQLDAKISITKQEAQRRLNDAVTRREAVIAEAKSKIISEIAKTKGDIKVNIALIDQIKNELEANIIKPAKAKRDRLFEEAKADAATIVENSKASAESFKSLVTAWKNAGANAKNIFLMEKIEPIFKIVTDSIRAVNIDKITVIDSNLTAGDNGNPVVKTISALEQLKDATGIDAGAFINRLKQYAETKTTPTTTTPTKKS
ncbi:flotillin family protein [bacterium]|nr:flotillin family protein [bacterium]